MKAGLLLASVVVLSGCQALTAQQNHCASCNPENIEQSALMYAEHGGNYLPDVNSNLARPTKPLSDYAADLALQLLQSMHYVVPEQPIAIATFVEFDHQLSNTTAVGNQLAEHMYVHMQRLGMAVADVKLARQIRVTPQGDLAFSRGAYLDTQQQLNYVLAGTILRDSVGLVVNARVMHLQTKAVVGSAQIHIPDFVLAAPTGIEPVTAP